MTALRRDGFFLFSAFPMPPRVRLVFTVLFSFLLLGVAWRWYFAPEMDHIAHLKAKQAKMRQAIAKAEEQHWDDIEGMKKEIARLDSRLTELRRIVPDYQDIPGMAVFLSELAERCKVKPAVEKEREVGIRIEKPVRMNGYTAYDIRLNVWGAPHQVYAFVSGVEQAPRMVQVRYIKWETRATNLVDCSVVVRVFVLGTPKRDPGNRPFMKFTAPESWPYEMMKPPLSVQPNDQYPGDAESAGIAEKAASELGASGEEISNPK